MKRKVNKMEHANKYSWSRAMEVSLIKLIHSHPELWINSSNNNNNKNRVYRKMLFNKILKELNDMYPSTEQLNMQKIMFKWRNLKVYFKSEISKELKSKRSQSKVYKSTWHHYKNMLFLKPTNDLELEPEANINGTLNSTENSQSTDISVNQYFEFLTMPVTTEIIEDSNEIVNFNDESSFMREMPSTSSQKRRKICKDTQTRNSQHISECACSKYPDSDFTKFLARRLSYFPESIKGKIFYKINNILYHTELEYREMERAREQPNNDLINLTIKTEPLT